MKNKVTFPALVLAVVFSSCTTSYKNSQTPDDLYYSPVKEIVVREEIREEEPLRRDETEIRMSVRDPRWRYYDYDYYRDYHYHPYGYGYTYGYYYNPHYYPYPVYGPTIRVENPRNSTPRMVNLGAYQPQTATIKDPKTGKVRTVTPGRTYNTNNTQTTRPRRIITTRSNDGNNDTRTYNPSTSSPSSGSSGGGSAPVSRPVRP